MKQKSGPWVGVFMVFLLTLGGPSRIAASRGAGSCAIPVRILADAYLIAPVWIEGTGPYSMLVDTGTTVTQIVPRVATRLRLRGTDRLLLSGPAGDRAAERVHISVRVGSAAVERLEAVITNLAANDRIGSIDGVLGQNFLAGFDYTVDYRARRLTLASAGSGAVSTGAPVPLEIDDGRPIVTAILSGRRAGQARTLRLILDSGASDLVLFEDRAALERTPGVIFAGTAAMVTNGGITGVATGLVSRVRIGPVTVDDVRFAALRRPGTVDGLLPARLLGGVQVSAARGQISIF